MNVNFSVKNVPQDVAEQLRRRAERNHRSLQGELLAILEAAAHEAAPATQRPSPTQPSVDETLGRLRALFPVANKPGSASTELIRELRDGRYGDAWAELGQHHEPN